jgi:hypothetical protein
MKKVTSLVALLATVSVAPAHAERDGQHDFDFEIGTWKTHLSRLVRPLSGSKTWVVYDGSPPPTIGAFRNGRGEFYDSEAFNGKPIRVRFTISNFTANSCHFEQAYSDDGGKSWETNWIATDTRINGAQVQP